jgi:hypothetical protein
LISRATLIALTHRTMQFDSIRITPPQPEFFFRLNYSCLLTGACLVPPLYGSLAPSRLCALPPVASTVDRARFAREWHLGITLGVCMSG